MADRYNEILTELLMLVLTLKIDYADPSKTLSPKEYDLISKMKHLIKELEELDLK
ncbi:hypothetical protein QA597_02510 [Marinilabiliaceae bacterium ANBcel2]|nr:hypothetical protein [Marinilabiliaceae bacterium ANBcel2]